MRKFLKWTTIILLAWYVVTKPAQAAADFNDLIAVLGDWANGLVTFLSRLGQ